MECNIVTIIAKNYLAQARTLVNSFKKYHPEGQAFVLLADRIDSCFDPAKENFTLIEVEELRSQIENLDGFCFQYSILELSTALKPYILKYLFQKYNLAKLAYFDPDILITNNFNPIFELLDRYNIVLTPHITSPYQDKSKPSEVELLQAGAYNLGFIALANTEVTASMLNWWEKRLFRRCLVDFSRGLFVDQKWIDLVPGLFPDICVLREPGYNVAYWNLHERVITIEDEKITCNGEPLYFFHFSGYNPDRPNDVSKHQDRHNFSNIGKASELFSLYTRHLMQNGYADIKNWPYSFSCFDNNVVIPDISRRIYLSLGDKQAGFFGNPFETSSLESYYHWLTTIDSKNKIPPLLYEVYKMRKDLQISFPNINGGDRYTYLFWFLQYGVVQYNLDNRLVENVKIFLKDYKNKIENRTIALTASDYNYSKRWNKVRSCYYSVRSYPVISLFIEKLKPFVVKHFKHKHRTPLTDDCFAANIQNSEEALMNCPENEELGVNLSGYINSEKGVGEGIRSDIRCLEHAGIPFVLNNFIDSGSVNDEMKNANLSTANPYLINLIHINADQVFEFIKQKGRSYLSNHYNIGYWAWELSQFPEEWSDAFREFDEIWVPSSFVQDTLDRISPVPVVKIPHSIRENVNQAPAFERSHFGIRPNDFLFLFIFDFDSFAARKNPLGTINAFKKAFSTKDNAILILKSSHSEHYPDDYKMLKEAADNENIKSIDRVMTQDELQALMQHADCYISLHRSEGFGLTMAEAMSMGKPVIATAYSGNNDFMTPWNNYSVRYNLVEVDRDYGPYKKGWFWADPDLEQAAYLMRYVYDHREEALRTGQTAKEYIQKYFSPIAVGQIYQERLIQIPKISRSRNMSSGTDNKIDDLSEHDKNMQEIEEKTINIDVKKVSVKSKKPIVGFIVQNYKRFIRKSTFWLLDPLISRIRESSLFMLHLQKTFDKRITGMEKLQEDLLGKISQHVQKFRDIESMQNLQNGDLQSMQASMDASMERQDNKIIEILANAKIEHQNNQEMFDANRTGLEQACIAIEANINALQQEVIIVKQGMQELSQTSDNMMHLVKEYYSESAFLRAKMAFMLQEIRTDNYLVNCTNINDITKNNAFHEIFSNTTWLYHAFEQQFRGTEAMIKEKQRLYIPDIQKSFEVCGGSVLDIGSGRGEFLELCLEASIPAIGVDLNEAMVDGSRAKGLDVKKADGLAYMESVQDESLCALTAFQVMEHLEPDQIWQFIQIALLKLRPGGVIILETVNTDNLYALKNFYLDLSHKRPIVSLTLRFLLEAAGFKDVEVRYSSPLPKEMELKGQDSDTQKINSMLFGNQDYSTLGWR